MQVKRSFHRRRKWCSGQFEFVLSLTIPLTFFTFQAASFTMVYTDMICSDGPEQLSPVLNLNLESNVEHHLRKAGLVLPCYVEDFCLRILDTKADLQLE